MDAVIAKLSELVGGTCADLLGVSQDILSLKNDLRGMNVLLTTLDDKEQLDPQLRNWRNQLVDTAYDIEDCIDDFKNNTTSVDAKASFISNVYNFLMNLRAHYDTAKQIKVLKTRMQEISERRKRLKIDDSTSSTTIIETLDPRMPALYNEADSLVGIDNPKEELIEWVLDEDQKLKVVSIVGRGGLGKTTLANKVYCEVGEQGGLGVTTHAKRFTHKAFVSVSRTPDWKRILTKMLRGNLSSGASDVQSLIDSLRQHLYDKRYLIVVDDLWCVPDWTNILRCAFPQNNQQSRVIVTTRDVEVARGCCSDRRYIHYMQPLSDTNSRTLFLKRISEDVCHFQNSKEVICEILKKCGGLPLAIITVASILACQEPRRLRENWECIQNSLSIHSATNPTLETMVQILDLSYRSLPHDLKPCFLYLGKYPEDHKIRRNDLVRQWVAEGFVRSHSNRDVWDIAQGYFNGLVNRSMIQPLYDCYDNTEVSACRVHDMMLDLILRRCREDNFITVVRDPQEVADVQYKVRRLFMDMSGAEDVTLTVAANSVLSQIRSLSMFGGPDWIPPFLKFKFIRVLFLEFHKDVKRMDLTCIIHLSQLRYFKIEYWSSPEVSMVLPSQIQRLKHLETLEFPGWFRDLSIPSGIVDLPRLSHLIVQGHRGLPNGIDKLNSLCTLVGFGLLNSSSENIRALGVLTNLVDLKLTCSEWISFQEKESSEETSSECMLTKTCALSSALEKLSRLKQIQISGEKYCRGDTLSSLSPPFHRLERFEMNCVAFPRVSKWIGSLRDLRKLTLVVDEISNSSWKDVSIIRMLPSLVFLSLQIPGVPVERIVITGFPVLKRFIFNCDGISRLSFEVEAMPNLWVLELRFHPCDWDKAAPAGLEHLPSLKEITATKVSYRSLGASIEETEKGMNELISGEKAEKESALIRVVFQEAVGALPTSPTFTFQPNSWLGCR